MLIDDYLPDFDVVERHGLVIRATPARVWDALRAADFGRSPLLATLLALRTLPSVLTAPRRTLRRLRERRARPLTLDTFFSRGFVLLEERPDREILIRPRGALLDGDRRSPPHRRAAVPGRRWPRAWRGVAWDFRAEPLPDGRVRLTTETRVRCADAATRRRFRAYWLLVRPGSGLIRAPCSARSAARPSRRDT